ncbi:MAG: hypothetical protein ABI761_09855 [Saprospiraceae bacterium]
MNKLKYGCMLMILWSSCKSGVTDVSTTDCSTVTGATFSSSSGQMFSSISSKCGGSSCHSAGGSESGRFLVTNNYASIKPLLATAARSVLNGTMPQNSSLTTAQLEQWQCWSNNGFPE